MITRVKPIDMSTDSSKEHVDSEKSSYSSKWKAFAANTTLHGLRYVVEDSHSISRRATWLLFLLTVAGAYWYYASISFGKFFSKPVKTIVSDETPIGGMKFPAVTICNLNKFMKSKIDVADEDEQFNKMGLNISGCSEIREVRGNLTCGQAMLCAFHPYGNVLVEDCNITKRQNIFNRLNRTSERLFDEEQFLAKYGHDITDMFVLYCRFLKLMECSDKDFVPILTGAGICFTFHSGHNSSAPILKSKFEGPDLGLNIVLDVQTNESTLSEFSSGLKVIVHDQDTYVNRHNGFNIFPGSHASVSVKLKKHIRLPLPYKTGCSRQNSLPGFGNYTKDGCIYQCVLNLTSDRCGCRTAGFPDLKLLPVCSFQDQLCIEESLTEIVNLTTCPCNNPCLEDEYESRVSYSKFPDASVTKLVQNVFGRNVSASYMQQNYVFLQVGFQHLAYEKREDVPSYGPESLFGELGGNMGLFLGCSILTVCEFINFLWEAVMARIRQRPMAENPQ